MNAQGQPLGEPYLEGSRAYLQVIDPGAAVSVPVDVSVTRSGDFEVLVLAETGVGTGVFEGSVELSNAVPVGNGRLETSRDVSQYPWRFDVLTATYGAAGDTATTVGSTVATLDAGGNPATSYVVGDRIYLRVTDAFANATAGVDTTVVNLSAIVGTWGEYETVLLTETGGNTSTFTGSILTAPGSDPVQQDGSLEIQPGSAIWAQHNDANGQTYSAVQVAALSNLPVTVQLTDPSGQPVASYQEFQPAVIRATDGLLAGTGSVTARVTSALRGDEEYVLLSENNFFSATFVGTVALSGTLSSIPAVANDGLLEVTEIAGPPLQRDTIHVELLGCSAAPCPTDSADMAGTSLRLTNAQGIDVGLVAPPASIVVEARDYSVPSWSPTSATVTSGGDAETVVLGPAAEYEIGLFRGTIGVEVAPPVPGDGALQVAASDVVTASRPDPLGLSSATDTAVVGSGLVSFLDSTGAPVDYVLTDGDIRIQAFNPEGNADPGAADSITVTVVSRDNTGTPRDTETLLLVETGTDTSSFTGQMPSRWYGYVTPFDGELQTAMTGYQLDTVDVTLGSTTATATMKVGIVRFVDASGADVGNVPPGGTIRLQVEAPSSNYDPLGPDLASIRLRSMTSGDDETFSLLETGPDTSIFETSLGSVIATAVPYNQVFETQLGETLQAEYYNYYHVAADIAVVGEGEPTNNPPLAVNDETTTGTGTPVVVDVLANDSDPEGQTFTVASFTQGTQGGTVTSNYAGFLTYTPPPSFLGTDTFTYRLVDLLGAEAFATVTITVVNQPPVAADDYLTLNEDQDVLLTPTDNDSDPGANALTIVAVTQGTLGTVSIYNQTLGYVRYTAQPNVSGSDAFTYTVANPQGATATATVYVTIQPVNDPPVAVNDTVTTAEDTLVNVQVRANDSDPDGDTIWVSTYTQGAHGMAGGDALSINYLPAANYNGTDTFTYTINDGNGLTSTATVTVTITPVNDPPVAVTDNATTTEDVPVTINARANDSDPDGHALSITATGTPFHGSVVINANGTLTYTPALNYNGTDWFNYTLTDSTGSTATGRVNLTITAVNDPPDAINDTVSTREDYAAIFYPMSNDTDADGNPLSFVGVTQGAHGLVEVFATSIRYTPTLNYNGPDSFTYTIRDGQGGTDTATVTMTITPEPDFPIAGPDSAATPEDTPAVIPVLANDSDPDGDALTLFTVTQGVHGSVTFTATTVTYTPQPNFSGTDSFTYTMGDPTSRGDTETVTVTVVPVNDPPSAANDAGTTPEDTPVTLSVLSNDSDLDGDALAVTAVTQGTNGSVSFNAGSVTYTPAANFNGADSFSYTISDGNGGSATATVSITITPVNDAPSAANDAGSTAEDSAVTLSVLSNDSDIDGGPLAVTAVTQGANGSVTFNAGSVTYTPAANFNGADSFTYTIGDGNGGSATATVSITVTPVNDPPSAANDAGTTAEDSPVTLAVLSNDSDPDGDALAVTAVTQGTNGSVSFDAGSVTYTPAANFNGVDSFTYTIGDGNGGSATATVSITVTPVNDTPGAANDAGTTAEDSPVTLSVLSNDGDLDGDALTVTAVTQGANGSVTFNAASVTYTPATNFNGADSFTYTIGDGNGGSATATVSITVNDVNDTPAAANDAGTTAEDSPVTLTVLSNDSDPDGDALAVTAVTQGANGSVSFDAGSVTYTPAANFNGSDSFTYTIGDGNGGSATATVSITVNDVNDTPGAANDTGTTAEDSPVTLSVLSNDSDPDGDALTVTAVTQGANGSVTFNAGSVTYTPAANFNGADSFTYTVGDGNGGSATATVSINVSAVNDAPGAANDAGSVAEDSQVSLSVLSNDSDPDGDTLAVTAVTQGANGSVSFNAASVTYTPAANFNGADSFTYTVSDGNGGSATATVSITVTPVNDPPDAVADTATTLEAGSGVVVTVLANDSDLEGNPLTVTTVSTPAHGTATRNADNTISYVPTSTYSGADSFTYTLSDGAGTDTATVTVQVKDVIGRVAVLGTHSVSIQTGADVLSGDVVANEAGSAPFLGATEVSLDTGTTTAAGWDVQGNRVTIASGAVLASDVYANQTTNGGTVTGAQYTPFALPAFATLPTFETGTPGTTDVSVGTGGTRTLAPGSYRNLTVAKKGTVTFTGGTYHFRSITLSNEAKLYFSAASTLRVEQKISTGSLVVVRPATPSTATAATIVFHVAGINGTTGALTATPKSVEIGVDNTLSANVYAPNGTLWIKDRTVATGAFLAKDVLVGPNAQVSLSSAW